MLQSQNKVWCHLVTPTQANNDSCGNLPRWIWILLVTCCLSQRYVIKNKTLIDRSMYGAEVFVSNMWRSESLVLRVHVIRKINSVGIFEMSNNTFIEHKKLSQKNLCSADFFHVHGRRNHVNISIIFTSQIKYFSIPNSSFEK